jgi:endonuclease/exonuclease/phosphatase family metal-dependent hydrolase
MRFKLTTWNCFGMARSVIDAITGRRAPAPQRLRHPAVASECAAPEVLCVQELFSRDALQFFDGLGSGGPAEPKAFSIRDDNRLHLRTVTVRGTGLGIRSRGAVVEKRQHRFRDCSGWDRLARKGLLHARIALTDSFELDVITAHLQAGDDRSAVAVRKHQTRELHEFVAGVVSPSRACIVAGDFNIDGLAAERDNAEYRGLTAALPDFQDLGARDDHATFDPTPHVNRLAFTFEPKGKRQRLDYVFLRPPRSTSAPVQCESISLCLHEPLAPPHSESHAFASDHFGLVATFSTRS